jgi:hypothetical protein
MIMIKTKKYKFGNLLFCNELTYYKIVNNALDIALLRLHYDLKTLKDFKVIVREELEDNKVYFYVEKWNSGFIKEYNFNDLLK